MIRKMKYFLLSLFLWGCSTQNMIATFSITQQPQPTIILATSEIGEVTPTNPAVTEKKESCQIRSITITDQNIGNIQWLPNGVDLWYQRQGDDRQYVYNLDTNTSNPYFSQVTSTPIPFRIDGYNIQEFYTSPTGDDTVFTVKSDAEGSPVYVVDGGSQKISFVGKIKGAIDDALWLDNGKKLLIAIDWRSPLGAQEAYAYMVDISNKKIAILLPNNSMYSDIAILGLTPDERYVLFTSYAGAKRTLQAFEIATGKSFQTGIVPPVALKWLSKPGIFLAAGFTADSALPRIYTYDFKTGEITYLIADPIDVNLDKLNSLKISPTRPSIAFINQKSEITLIDCPEK